MWNQTFRFPAVETISSHQSSRNPYSFAPNIKAKHQRLPQSSDGVISEFNGIRLVIQIKKLTDKLNFPGPPMVQCIHLGSRPKTHPPTIEIQPSSANGRANSKKKQTEIQANSQKKNR